jgi:hypothetical protein
VRLFNIFLPECDLIYSYPFFPLLVLSIMHSACSGALVLFGGLGIFFVVKTTLDKRDDETSNATSAASGGL